MPKQIRTSAAFQDAAILRIVKVQCETLFFKSKPMPSKRNKTSIAMHRGFVFVVLWSATPGVHHSAPISFVWTWAMNLPHGFLWCKGDAKTIFPVVKVCFLKAKLSTSCASSAHLKTGNTFSRTTMKTVGRSYTRKIETIMNGIIGSVSLLWNFSTNLS